MRPEKQVRLPKALLIRLSHPLCSSPCPRPQFWEMTQHRPSCWSELSLLPPIPQVQMFQHTKGSWQNWPDIMLALLTGVLPPAMLDEPIRAWSFTMGSRKSTLPVSAVLPGSCWGTHTACGLCAQPVLALCLGQIPSTIIYQNTDISTPVGGLKMVPRSCDIGEGQLNDVIWGSAGLSDRKSWRILRQSWSFCAKQLCNCRKPNPEYGCSKQKGYH